MAVRQAKWPLELVIVRHGESAGNVARDAAHAKGLQTIDIAQRDCDVPLSPLGERQATALGAWMAQNDMPIDVVVSSPYLRAEQTAKLAMDSAGWPGAVLVIDERLREKDLGLLDGLTMQGFAARYPEQFAMRKRLGKFYYRPPGGESWNDVILRLRSFIDVARERYAERRMLLVAHQVVVLCLRYLLEDLTEREILDIDAQGDVANCSLTRYVSRNGALALDRYNFTAPMEEKGQPVTAEPETRVATN